MRGKLAFTTNLRKLEKLAKDSPKAFKKGMEKGGIQFLTWSNAGSVNSSLKPPIRWGVLRGSSSVFIGGKLLKVYPQAIDSRSKEQPTPAKSHSAPDDQITWVWNTDYAAKMHEWDKEWGEFTVQDGNSGRKWVEEHLDKDRNDFLKVVAIEARKEMFTL